jgi:hypothetical protein
MNINTYEFNKVIPHLHEKGSPEKFFDAYARIKLVSKEEKRTLVIMVQIANKDASHWNQVDLFKDAKIMKKMPHTLLRDYVEEEVKSEGKYKLKNNKNDEVKWDDEFWRKVEQKLESINYLGKIKEAIEAELSENGLTKK